MKITYEMTTHPGGILIKPRISHVVGQLISAAMQIQKKLIVDQGKK